MNRNSLFLFFLICTINFSCDNQPVFNQYQLISNGRWEQSDEFVFSFEIADTTQSYNLTLQLRNTNLYPFRNLWITYEEETPEGKCPQDTISITLADQYGNWLGNGISLFETEHPLKTKHFFPRCGTYTFRIKHLMYKDPLEGIQEVGLLLLSGSI